MIKKFKYIRILHCLFGSVKLTKNADPDKYVLVTVLDPIHDQNFHDVIVAYEKM